MATIISVRRRISVVIDCRQKVSVAVSVRPAVRVLTAAIRAFLKTIIRVR